MNRTAPIVLGVIGSSRSGGNTETLVREVLRGARDAGAVTDEALLGELEIHPCIGCDACRRTGHCIHSDDMEAVARKMLAADVWVLGTPVYFFAPTALFKAFLERWYSLPGETFERKKAILAIPLESTSMGDVAATEQTLQQTLRYKSVEHIGSILAPGLLEVGAAQDHPEFLSAARDLGQQVATIDPERAT